MCDNALPVWRGEGTIQDEIGGGEGQSTPRGRSMKKKSTQSRGGVKGGFPLAGSRGGAPLWGLGQRPNCSTGDHFAKRAQQRRRQRSVPASNFAHPQMRPPTCSFHHLNIVAPIGATEWQFFPNYVSTLRYAGISPLRRRRGGFPIAPSTPSAPPLLGLSAALLFLLHGESPLRRRNPHPC